MKRILTFLLISGLLTVFAFGGIEWSTSIITTGKDKKANNDITTHTYAQGGDVKQVFEGVAKENPFNFQDGYWLFKGKSEQIYIVNDKKKTYMVMDLDTMLQAAGMAGQMVKITITDQTANTAVLPDETIMGYSCNHFKITTEYTMKIKVFFIKKTMRVHEEKEVWGTNDIPGIKEIGQSFMKKEYKTGFPDLDEMIQKQMEEQKKIGFPLKMITYRYDKDKKDRPQNESTTTMIVSNMAKKDFPKSMFEVPADYTETQMKEEGGNPFAK